MTRIIDQLGVQSFCYRHFKNNTDVITQMNQSGFKRIELCRIHVDFANTAEHQAVIDLYHNAGIVIPSVGVENIDVDKSQLEPILQFAKAAGANLVTANFSPSATEEQLDAACRLAAEYDVRFGIHNHGGQHWLGNSEMLEWIFSQAKKRGDTRLGLCIDTAWAVDARQNPVQMAEQFADRLWGVHIKDMVFDRAREPHDVIVGQGNLDLPKFIQTLEKNGFNGSCVLEYEGDVENPAPALTQCVEAVRNASLQTATP